MHIRTLAWWVGGVITLAIAFGGGCDFTAKAPSVNTDTEINAPLVAGKTFRFLGNPQDNLDPLIDTTSSSFDSLFTVGPEGEPENAIFVEQEINSFDIGSLDQAIDQASEGVGLDTSLAEALISGDELARQDVQATYSSTIEAPPPVPKDGAQVESPLPRGVSTTFPFPSKFLQLPDFDAISAEADVQSGTLTDETEFTGGSGTVSVNDITFEVENNGSSTTPLSRSGGSAPPRVSLVRGTDTLRNAKGQKVAGNLGTGRINPGETGTVTLDVQGATLGTVGGTDTEIVLTVDGNERQDVLRTTISSLRYQSVDLVNVSALRVTASETRIGATGGTNTQFAGLNVREGNVAFGLTNNLQFPVRIDTLEVKNNKDAANAPGALKPTGISATSASDFQTATLDPTESSTVIDKDLSGNGIASVVDVSTLSASLNGEQATEPITVAAGDGLGVSLSTPTPLTIQTLYFWPKGETLKMSDTFRFEQDRLTFGPSDYVQLQTGTISLRDLDYKPGTPIDNPQQEPDLVFESFSFTYPQLSPPQDDSLTIRFEGTDTNPASYDFPQIRASDAPKDFSAPLDGLRINPTNDQVEYQVKASLGRVPDGQERVDNLSVIGFEDSVKANVVVEKLDIDEVRAGLRSGPVAVNITEDTDNSGTLDLASEANEIAFDGFSGIAGRVGDDLGLQGGTLTFSIETNLGSNAALYAAIQGRQGNTQTYLSGRTGSDTHVSGTDPRNDDFAQGGAPIASGDLIQLGFAGADLGATASVTDTKDLTHSNSTVDEFISALPTSLRFAGKALLTGKDVPGRSKNRIFLSKPVTFNAGLNVSVPLRFGTEFTVRDTVDADFSALADVTDPEQNLSISTAELTVRYGNALPLGVDIRMAVVDANGNVLRTFPADSLSIKPAPKNEEGAATGEQNGTVTLSLGETQEEIQELTDGEAVRLRLTMTQAPNGPAAQIQADDEFQLKMSINVDASVNTNS
ncbi:MAG: hypothetical protein ABEL97_14620 [Salinibacter sp.]